MTGKTSTDHPEILQKRIEGELGSYFLASLHWFALKALTVMVATVSASQKPARQSAALSLW